MKRKTIKVLLAAAAAFLSVYMFAGGALADSSAAGTVNVSNYLNIRQSYTTSSSVIGTLSNSANVTVLGNTAGWYKISSGNVTGWVNGHYVTLEGTAKVSQSLNVRLAGSAGAIITGRLYNGTVVTITDSSADGWFKISYNGGSGWVNGQYLTLGNSFMSGTSKQQAVTDAAQRMIGVKYSFGGTTVGGIDCSGLTINAYSKIGITLPHSAATQATLGTAVSRNNLQPGDLVFFDTDGGNNNITHVGIYIGNDIFVNAETGSVQRVNECSLSNSYWSAAFMTARRIIS